MAENPQIALPESTESLMKVLCFHLAENKQDVADGFYSAMRDVLGPSMTTRQSSPKPNTISSRQHSTPRSQFHVPTESPFAFTPENRLANDEFYADHQKVSHYLQSVNKGVSKEFTTLSDKILRDHDIFLSKRNSSLAFLMKLGKKIGQDEMIVEHTPMVLGLDKNKNRQTSRERRAANPVEDIYPVARNLSNTSSINSTGRGLASHSDTKLPALNGQGRLADSGVGFSGLSSISGASQAWSQRTAPRAQPATPPPSKVTDVGNSVTEWELVQGVIFAWQGIAGDIFKLDAISQTYIVSEKITIDSMLRERAESLTWLGYLHNAVRKFTTADSSAGIVRKCLISYLRDQLAEYYTYLASVQTQLAQEVQREQTELRNGKSRVTLERLRLFSLHPVRTFQDLITVLEFTAHDKGGGLASGVHCYLQHGNPDVQSLVKAILSEMCKPLYQMLTKWLLDGEVSDPHKEFFIADNSSIVGDRLWHEKYTVRTTMLPEFISVEQAAKILSVGRSINFLKEVCNDEEPLSERDKLKDAFQNTDVEVMYLLEREDEMTSLIDLAYKKTNKRVMSVLVDKYSLLDHFQAHRKYLLLGQGDFIYHLMDLLSEVLDRPADQLAPHHLNTVLDTAVRSTSAQHEQENILNRLDAAIMTPTRGDLGWDVFYLRYHVDGPIGTVFSVSKEVYQMLFYALWKAKRMEMVLSKLWQKITIDAKTFRSMSELNLVLAQCSELTSEIVHFIRQSQYYFLFEVLECSWNQLMAKIQQADCLDDVIHSHQVFLRTIQTGVFQDEDSQAMSNQLRIVYGLIIDLRDRVDDLLRHAQLEMEERIVSDLNESEYEKRRKDFVKRYLPNTQAYLKQLGNTYRDTVKKLLLMLNSQNELSLQLLSTRLDFNEHYNSLDARLNAPLTFHHRRMSSTGSSGFSPLLSRKVLGTSRNQNSIEERLLD